MGLGHFNKVFVKNAKEKAPQANNLETFSPRYSSNYLLNGRFNPSMNTIRVFFSKIRALFSIFKKRQGGSPPGFYMVGISVMKELNLNREINLA